MKQTCVVHMKKLGQLVMKLQMNFSVDFSRSLSTKINIHTIYKSQVLLISGHRLTQMSLLQTQVMTAKERRKKKQTGFRARWVIP